MTSNHWKFQLSTFNNKKKCPDRYSTHLPENHIDDKYTYFLIGVLSGDSYSLTPKKTRTSNNNKQISITIQDESM